MSRPLGSANAVLRTVASQRVVKESHEANIAATSMVGSISCPRSKKPSRMDADVARTLKLTTTRTKGPIMKIMTMKQMMMILETTRRVVEVSLPEGL